MLSPQRRMEMIGALRRGTVPQRSLDLLAVGLDPFEKSIGEELDRVAGGGAVFKCVRGEYGAGKTFFGRWLQEQARQKGFATSEVQISETETPLHRLETVYRRSMERLATADVESGALRSIIDGWFYSLEEDAAADGADANDSAALLNATQALLTKRLAEISKSTSAYAAALRGYREALARGDQALAEGLIGWLSGQPNVAADVKRAAGIKGEIDHYGALSFLRGLLTILRDSGRAGLVLVIDEVETLQRVRGDVREKSLNALRQLLDEVDGGRFPGLYVLITGTPSFYDGPQGAQRLPPLAQRLHVEFMADARFDNPRAVQIRLQPFDSAKLITVGCRVRDIFLQHCESPDRIKAHVTDGFVAELAKAVAGKLGGKTGLAPRLFLKKLVGEILDVVDLHPDFDPKKDYTAKFSDSELDDSERAAIQRSGDIPLNI